MTGPRIVVTGGRDFNDADLVNRVLTRIDPSEIAEGGASGADRLVALWAHENDVPCTTFPAKWALHGRAAGPIRNRQMLEEFSPDLLVAFPGGRGTANAVSLAEKMNIPVVYAEEEE